MCATPSCLAISGRIVRRALVMLRRRARDDFQIGDLRQARQDFVLDAVGEIGVGFVFAPVIEWKHGNAFFGRSQRRSARLRENI